MEKRVAKVEGLYLQGEPNECFSGTITFELRPDCICYGWSINTKEGIWLKGMSVSLRVIPEDKEYFEFALQHSLEGLRRYRSNRQKVFDVESCA